MNKLSDATTLVLNDNTENMTGSPDESIKPDDNDAIDSHPVQSNHTSVSMCLSRAQHFSRNSNAKQMSLKDLANWPRPFKIELYCLRAETIRKVKQLCMESYQPLSKKAKAGLIKDVSASTVRELAKQSLLDAEDNQHDGAGLSSKFNKENCAGEPLSISSKNETEQTSLLKPVSNEIGPPKKRTKLDTLEQAPTADSQNVEANSIWQEMPPFIFGDCSADNSCWRPQLEIDLLDDCYTNSQLADTVYDPNGFLHVPVESAPKSRVVGTYRNEARRRIVVVDLCDCCSPNCPGCFMPCLVCSSTRCGFKCRCNRVSKPVFVRVDGAPKEKLFSPVRTSQCVRGLSNFRSAEKLVAL